METSALRSDAAGTGGSQIPERDTLQPCPFRVEDATRDRLAAGLDRCVLACLSYGDAHGAPADPRMVPVGLPRLDTGGVAELWVSDEPVEVGISDGIHHATNSRVLFGWLQLTEQDLATTERSVLRAYVHIDQLMNRLGYPYWPRAWNFLAHINRGNGDQERYRQFSVGRHHAVALKPGFEQELPAATAIGTHTEGLTLCFLAGRRPALQVENPRQVSAFRYPREYGPRSPSFSRATLQHWRDCSTLLLSGTASVVGHASLHPGDASLQLAETLANIDALLQNAALLHLAGERGGAFAPQAFKLYVRSEADYRRIEDQVRARLSVLAPVAVLQGDICRTDLLMEIEAAYTWRDAPRPG